ncbi:MAG: hypothetical protein EBS83_11650, partial [Planctomycetia bacterium]|nr:hypothetical protein [Planctomycetia bacterium]
VVWVELNAGKPEARARGEAVPGEQTVFPSACASGFQLIVVWVELNAGKPEARARGEAVPGEQTLFPSACASGF